MKVKELIEKLKTYDGDINVYIPGYEGGVNDLSEIGPEVNVALNVNNEWYYGAHEANGDGLSDKYEKAKGIILE